MRFRLVLAGGAIATVVIVATPSVAGAAGETIAECIDKKVANKQTDYGSCAKASNPILPAANEIIWGGLAFIILFVIMAWKVFPAATKAMHTRSERIRSDLDSAEDAKNEATRVLDDYRAQLADARAESTRIIDEARRQAEALKSEQMGRLNAELAEMRAKAADDIEASKQRAIAELQSQVASLAIGAAERIVERSLDRSTQEQLVESFIREVGARA